MSDLSDPKLNLLFLGQRIGISKLQDVTNVEELIALISKWKSPPTTIVEGEPGTPYVDSGVDWLIAMDLDIGGSETQSFANLQAVFKDPGTYALHVTLTEGLPEKIDFEVSYQRLEDKLGVYKTDIQLPDSIRQFMVGGYTVTMPNIGVMIYTNGDYRLDFGFPWNLDFSRSFLIEGFMPPGIPVLGAGGFYIGKLSNTVASPLPKPRDGSFSPAMIFGFGMQVGLGKAFKKGPLEAGFSLTAVGILEGVMAQYYPSSLVESPRALTSLLDDSYYRVTGTAGIVGKLYGSINFPLIKADVNVDMSVLSQLVIEAYRQILITVSAQVDVAATVKIGCGWLSRKFHFSYAANIEENFTIGKRGTAPWEDPIVNSPLLVEPAIRLATITPVWSHLLASSHGKTTLTSTFVPTLTVNGDAATGSPSIAYVALLTIDADEPLEGDIHGSKKSLESLAEFVLMWILSAFRSSNASVEEMRATAVTKEELEILNCYLTNDDTQLPIPIEQTYAFMDRHFKIALALPKEVEDPANRTYSTFFPMIPKLKLLRENNGVAMPEIHFETYHMIDDDYLRCIGDKIAVMRVQVEDRITGSSECSCDDPIVYFHSTYSAAAWVWTDYFLLIARLMVQEALEVLNRLPYEVPAGKSLLEMINDWEKSPTPVVFASNREQIAIDVFERNSEVKLTISVELSIRDAVFLVPSDCSIQKIVETYDSMTGGPAFTEIELGRKIATLIGILRVDAVITCPGLPDYNVKKDDSLASIATTMGLSLDDFLIHSDVTTALLVPSVELPLPLAKYILKPGDTLASIASLFGLKLSQLAYLPTGPEETKAPVNVLDLFERGTVLWLPELERYPFELLMEAFRLKGVFRNLSGWVARQFMHGMRLPDPNGGCDDPTKPEMGLYALTGQQFDLPSTIENYSASLEKPETLNWVEFV